MGYQRFLNIKVKCPRNGRVQEMQVRFVKTEDGRDFPTPVNGCDEACGEQMCYKCSAAITMMFYRGYEYFPPDIVIPDFLKTK